MSFNLKGRQHSRSEAQPFLSIISLQFFYKNFTRTTSSTTGVRQSFVRINPRFPKRCQLRFLYIAPSTQPQNTHTPAHQTAPFRLPPASPSPSIGIPLREVSTAEGSDPEYIANEGQSCFHCKTHLYSALEAVAAQAGVESHRHGSASGGGVVLFNGTNKDDKRDHTRWARVNRPWQCVPVLLVLMVLDFLGRGGGGAINVSVAKIPLAGSFWSSRLCATGRGSSRLSPCYPSFLFSPAPPPPEMARYRFSRVKSVLRATHTPPTSSNERFNFQQLFSPDFLKLSAVRKPEITPTCC